LDSIFNREVQEALGKMNGVSAVTVSAVTT